MKKNFKIKARRPWGTAVEIGMPLVYAVFAFGFSMMRTELDAPSQNWFAPELIDGLNCAGWTPILFAPAGAREIEIMTKVAISARAFDALAGPPENPYCGSAFNTWAEMRDVLLTEDEYSTRLAVLLDVSGSSDWSYQIMHRGFNNREVDRFDRQWVKEGEDWEDKAVGAHDGTLALQLALDRAMAEVHTPGALAQMDTQGGFPMLVAKLPLRALKTGYQPGLTFVLLIVPFYVTFGMSYIGAIVIKELAQEREKKLDEGMKVMGLSAANEKLGNALTIAIVQFFAPIVTTIIIKVLGFAAFSNHFLIFVHLLIFEYGIIASVFLLLPLLGRTAKQAEVAWWVCGIAPSLVLFVLNGIWPVLGNGLLSDLIPGLFWPSLLYAGAAGPMGMLLFLIAEFEGVGLESATAGSYPLLGVWAMMIFDIVLYGVLGYVFEQRRQGLALFPSRATILRRSRSTLPVDDQSGAPAGVVQVVHLCKEFPAKPLPFLAVKDLSFEMKEGEVTALLGQNGAGKSTAINIFTGLCQPTSGYATVYGYRVPEDISIVRKIMGVCPQHDLLFETLSVFEHFRLFADVKHLKKQESIEFMNEWTAKLGIKDKVYERTGTLSGGQKRKVSCAIALLGSPRFVMLDEPTAGMDPHSRRGVWEAVQQAKTGRAVLLTTHFMDEADALANFIVVISHGTLCASGTSLELKNQFGDGYRLHTALKPDIDPARTLAATQEFVPGARVEEQRGCDATLMLPQDGVGHFGELFKSLDNRMPELGLTGYGITLPSLQDVFLKIVAKQGGQGAYDDAARTKQAAADSAAQAQASPPFKDPSLGSQLNTMLQGRLGIKWKASKTSCTGCIIIASLIIIAGFLLPMILELDPLPDPLAPPPATTINAKDLASKADVNLTVPYYPRSSFPGTLEYGFTPKPFPGPALVEGQDPQRILAESIEPAAGILNGYVLNEEPAGNATAVFTTMLYNSSWPNSLPAFVNLFDQALVESAAPGLTITTKVSNLPRSPDAKTVLQPSENALPLLPILVPLLCMMTVFLMTTRFVGDVGTERFDGIKHRMLLSGLDVRIYWFSIFLDITAQLLLILSFVGVIAAQATSQLLPESALSFLLVTVLACTAVALFTFLLTFPLSSSTLGLNVDTFQNYYSLFFMAISMLPSILSSFIENPDTKFTVQVIALLVPMNQLVEGMRAICIIDSSMRLRESLKGEGPSVGDYFRLTFDPLELLGMEGAPGVEKTSTIGPGLVLIYAVGCIVVYGFLMWWLEVRRYTVPHRRGEFTGDGATSVEDEDVVAERERVLKGSDDDLSAKQLRKHFSKLDSRCGRRIFKAVDGISFSVAKGTCFALLGPNGAGKTTAINMLTGDTWPTQGTASICGNTTADAMLKIFKITGFCPQFKGLWKEGSLRDHLWIFCRLKGLVGADLDSEIDRLVLAYGLEEHQHKQVQKCSGGTQRKLSCALALSVGEPRVTFLDEPTTGVDVGTRRFIWDRIKDSTRNSVVVLTTHYMDEADALAQRIGIMVGGKLAAIGSPQHLKLRHGRAYRVQLKGPADKERELTELVMTTFGPKSKLVEGHSGLLSFEVEPGFALSRVFPVFEDAKTSLNLETYSLQQTTLEDVFLNVAGRGETSRPEPPGAPPAKYSAKVSGSGEAKANLLGRPADNDIGVTEVP